MWRRISTWMADTRAVFFKEWRCELRTRYALNTVGLFAFTTLVVVSIALGPIGISAAVRPVLPVLLWLIVLFAATAGLPRTFVHEEEIRTATALRLTATPSSLFCGKACFNLTLLLALEVMVGPLFVILLQVPVASPASFAMALFTGGYGLAVASTLIAAMVAQARIRGPLFAVLSFPILLPLLRFAIDLTLAAMLGEPSGIAMRVLILYDASLTVASLMLFPAVWNP